MKDQYSILIDKLDQFIRKYYKNQLIRGVIYFITLLVILFLTVTILEYFGHFNTTTRTILFWIFILGVGLILTINVIRPLSKLYKIGKIISHEQAAKIIGKHFEDVHDKLLNTLQLKSISEQQVGNLDLIQASIDQKIAEIKPVPFQSAVDFSVNKKYLKYLIIPVFVLLAVLVSSPTTITDPATRLVKHTTYFEKPLPFTIQVLNDNFEVLQNNDFELKVKIEGEEVPDKVYLQSGNNRIKFQKESTVQFNYTFVNVQKDQTFKIVADELESSDYELKVLPKPVILNFDINVDYPSYTGKKDEIIHNNGDLIIPVGTKASWKFYALNTDSISIQFGADDPFELLKGPQSFDFDRTLYKSKSYVVKTANAFVSNLDSLSYSINVIPDLYPVIAVDEYRDSLFEQRFYFNGTIKDDYGFKRLTFNYLKVDNQKISESPITDTIAIQETQNPQEFLYYFELADVGLEAGSELEYYFEVWDNDGINGSKSSRSQIMSYKIPTLEEINKAKDESNQEIKEEMEEAIRDVKELQKDIDQINKKLIDRKELNWEDKEQIKQLLEKQKELENKLEELKQKNAEKSIKEQQFKQVDEQILEKQKQLEELFEKLMENEELKDLFKELQEMMDELEKDKVNEMLEEMKLSNEDLEKMLDRNLEIFKQLEFEQKLEETIERMNDLAEKQENLSEQTRDKKQDLEESKKQQENLNEEFESLQEDLEQLDEMNKEMESPNEFNQMEEQQEGIEEEMQNSMNEMNQGQRKNASKSQKNASEKMKKMAQNLFDMQQQMISESMGEDIENLRDILENLIQLSFDQESLIDRVNEINVNDPQYTGLIQDQNKIKDELQMVSDSLFALSKRQIMIKPFVTKEINSINQNIEKSLDLLNNRNTNQAAGRQQYVMTSINNLALMLSETLNQMMQAMMMQSQSSSSCKNPGSGMSKPGQGKTTMESLRKMQEQLNDQIEQMKSGKQQKGPGSPNGKMNQMGQSMSEQLARSAAQQEYIRNELNKMAEQLEKEGQFGSSKELKKISSDMEKTETDLVNKMLSQETLMRQKQILTRLLKSEKAEMEREKEEKRESIEGKNKYSRNPEDFSKYKRVQQNEVELLRTVPPSLKPFYKNKVDQYFFNFEELLEQ
ncbi:MAG: DUF4175 domain-containing protein [Bacteroidetes bacterium]|nr:DUF4175 domain-containing protein [Bacteroidota bacterium]